jgi:hypothetical protein
VNSSPSDSKALDLEELRGVVAIHAVFSHVDNLLLWAGSIHRGIMYHAQTWLGVAMICQVANVHFYHRNISTSSMCRANKFYCSRRTTQQI